MRIPIAKFALMMALLGRAPGLVAGQDWAHLKAVRVAEPGAFRVGFALAHSVEQTWARGNAFSFLKERNGDFKIQRLLSAQLDMGWQADEDWGLKFAVPYRFAELSAFPAAGAILNPPLNDPALRRNESIGDVSVELRRAWGVQPGVTGSAAALWLGVMAPTGLGPFEASHSLAATGQGRWQVEPGVLAGASNGTWSCYAQIGAPVQWGQNSTLSGAAVLGYGPAGPLFPTGGNVYLGPRFSVQSVLGLGWDWYHGADSRQTVALELQGWQRSPLDQGGTLTADTEQVGLRLTPQLLADFGAFQALAGWDLPFIYAVNEASADFGVAHMRVDYGF